MRSFRNSQLALRRECPWAYRRAYIDGDPGVPSPSLRAGANVHAAAAETVKALVTDGMADVHRIAHRTVRGGDVEYTDALAVVTRLQEAIGVEFDIDPGGVILLEERIEMPIELRTGESVVFYGTPDLVERVARKRCRITDWKTHWRPESEHEFRAGQQLKRYALLVASQFGAFEEFELVKRFIRYRGNAYTETLTRDDLAAVREMLASEIEETIEFEETGDFTPTPGSWCTLCTQHHTCPVIRRYREIGVEDLAIEDDERARQLAGDAIALDAAAAALKDRVKRYLGGEHATGRVPVAGGFYGYAPVEKREIPYTELAEALREHGVEVPTDLARTDARALDRLTRKLPEDVVAAIEKITRRWQESDCRFRRAQANTAAPSVAAAHQEDLL